MTSTITAVEEVKTHTSDKRPMLGENHVRSDIKAELERLIIKYGRCFDISPLERIVTSTATPNRILSDAVETIIRYKLKLDALRVCRQGMIRPLVDLICMCDEVPSLPDNNPSIARMLSRLGELGISCESLSSTSQLQWTPSHVLDAIDVESPYQKELKASDPVPITKDVTILQNRFDSIVKDVGLAKLLLAMKGLRLDKNGVRIMGHLIDTLIDSIRETEEVFVHTLIIYIDLSVMITRRIDEGTSLMYYANEMSRPIIRAIGDICSILKIHEVNKTSVYRCADKYIDALSAVPCIIARRAFLKDGQDSLDVLDECDHYMGNYLDGWDRLDWDATRAEGAKITKDDDQDEYIDE